ncbi:hypothetical protein DYB28_000257 [Aphanomyces astaci]|uniref:Uncharacterized protein n=1 Tax=Aphanomyces astaci TaxID=112090 RepID=A0A9X8DZV1_APHAT|nr:hypothetical protein DYB28_000257 [Aphanomyces astaci]
MRKLRNILPAARLRRLTPLRAKTLNATRWTSGFSLTRYSAIKTFIGQTGDNDIDMLRLSPVEEREVDALLVVLGDLSSITLALPCGEFSLRAANSKDPNIELLVFNGIKKSYRFWTQKFEQHLKALTTAKVGQWLAIQTSRPEPKIKFKDWLYGEPPVIHGADESEQR